MELPSDWYSRFTKVIASRDKGAAINLLARMEAATAAGNAKGFGPEMSKLSEIAGRPMAKAAPSAGLGTYQKRAPVAPVTTTVTVTLPPQLQKMAEDASERIRSARGHVEKAAAMEHGREVLAKLQSHTREQSAEALIKQAFAHPRRMA